MSNQTMVYVVEDSYNSPGKIRGIFAAECDAIKFADSLNYPCIISAHVLWHGLHPLSIALNELG